jgi:hypothetical protein
MRRSGIFLWKDDDPLHLIRSIYLGRPGRRIVHEFKFRINSECYVKEVSPWKKDFLDPSSLEFLLWFL